MPWQKLPGYFQFSLFAGVLLVALTFNPAVRAQDRSDGGNGAFFPLPTTFSQVQAPDIGIVGALGGDLENDVWAVPGDGAVSLHFDGNTWNSVPMAKAGRMGDVAVLSSDDVWAVGRNVKGARS